MSLALEVKREEKPRLKAPHTLDASLLNSLTSEDNHFCSATGGLVGLSRRFGAQILRASWSDALRMTNVRGRIHDEEF
jgi:hypothetical protein